MQLYFRVNKVIFGYVKAKTYAVKTFQHANVFLSTKD